MPFFQKLFGPPDIEQLRARRDIKGLLKALGYKASRSVRLAAVRALNELKDARAVEPLIAALQDSDHNVRQYAVRALNELKDARAIEPLIATLQDSDQSVRMDAVRALGELKDARVVEPLIAALKEHPEMWREIDAVLKSLVPSTDPRRCVEIQALVHEAEVLATIVDLKSGRRDDAAKRLGELGDLRAIEPLIAALKDKRDHHTIRYLRWKAAEALGKLGDLRAIEPLIAMLRDENKGLVETAAEALGKLGDPRAIDSLIAAADKIISEAKFDVASRTGPDGEIYERHPFEDGPLKALERIGGPKATQTVEELCQKRRKLQERDSK